MEIIRKKEPFTTLITSDGMMLNVCNISELTARQVEKYMSLEDNPIGQSMYLLECIMVDPADKMLIDQITIADLQSVFEQYMKDCGLQA